MTKYEKLADSKLEVLVEADNPEALCEKALRAHKNGDTDTAKKFFILSAQLFFPAAYIELGEIFHGEGNAEAAAANYKAALSLGQIGVTADLAEILMEDSKDEEALELLISGAMMNDSRSVAMLEKYYDEHGSIDWDKPGQEAKKDV